MSFLNRNPTSTTTNRSPTCCQFSCFTLGFFKLSLSQESHSNSNSNSNTGLNNRLDALGFDSIADSRPGRSPTPQKKDFQSNTCTKPHRQTEECQRSTGALVRPLGRVDHQTPDQSKRRPRAPAFVFVAAVEQRCVF
jgi:hypothetical protein